jgi:enoyl-CoA hydratase
LLAKIYDPESAVQAGYLDETLPADQVIARALAEASRLGAFSQMAFRATKARLRGQTIKYITAEMDADMRDLMMPTR